MTRDPTGNSRPLVIHLSPFEKHFTVSNVWLDDSDRSRHQIVQPVHMFMSVIATLPTITTIEWAPNGHHLFFRALHAIVLKAAYVKCMQKFLKKKTAKKAKWPSWNRHREKSRLWTVCAIKNITSTKNSENRGYFPQKRLPDCVVSVVWEANKPPVGCDCDWDERMLENNPPWSRLIVTLLARNY